MDGLSPLRQDEMRGPFSSAYYPSPISITEAKSPWSAGDVSGSKFGAGTVGNVGSSISKPWSANDAERKAGSESWERLGARKRGERIEERGPPVPPEPKRAYGSTSDDMGKGNNNGGVGVGGERMIRMGRRTIG